MNWWPYRNSVTTHIHHANAEKRNLDYSTILFHPRPETAEKNKEMVDVLSASIILQTYLDRKK